MMTKEEVQAVVSDLRQADVLKVGVDYFNQAAERLEKNGWKLCLKVTSHVRTRGTSKARKWLQTPKMEFYVQACFVNLKDPREWVFYYENKEPSKRVAQSLAEGHEWPNKKPLWQL